jgi:hypothetical protein
MYFEELYDTSGSKTKNRNSRKRIIGGKLWPE